MTREELIALFEYREDLRRRGAAYDEQVRECGGFGEWEFCGDEFAAEDDNIGFHIEIGG